MRKDRNSITEPYGESGNYYRDTTKIFRPAMRYIIARQTGPHKIFTVNRHVTLCFDAPVTKPALAVEFTFIPAAGNELVVCV